VKESAQRKRSSMSLVSPATLPADDYFYRPTVQPKSNQRGLHAVAPQEIITPPRASQLTRNAGLYSATLPQRLPSLTTEEFVQVSLATVRESSRHRYWPSDVVETFLVAEVVTH
jgi:hypothetical protein